MSTGCVNRRAKQGETAAVLPVRKRDVTHLPRRDN